MARAHALRRLLLAGLLMAGCRQLDVRVEIEEANEAYKQQKFDVALAHYLAAQRIDSSFAELDRMIGYSHIGQFEPEDTTPENERHADSAIASLRTYLDKRPDDAAARDSLISLYLAANRPLDAIAFFENEVKKKPGDLDSVKSLATLYAKQGDFPGALRWYREITRIDAKNPEAYYILGVVLFEKVAKTPEPDEAANLLVIEEGKAVLAKAIALRPDYFEALVYMNLHLRQQASRETDEQRKEALFAQADEFRTKAIAIQESRKAADARR